MIYYSISFGFALESNVYLKSYKVIPQRSMTLILQNLDEDETFFSSLQAMHVLGVDPPQPQFLRLIVETL